MIIAHTEKIDYVFHKAAVITAEVIVQKKGFIEFTANPQRNQMNTGVRKSLLSREFTASRNEMWNILV